MNTSTFLAGLSLTAALFLSACSSSTTTANATAGGMMGTAAGVGAGAIVGSVISNGDVGQSALLGGAIGLPVGILAGVAYSNYSDSAEIADNTERIIENKQHIIQQDRELEYLRNKIRDDSSTSEVGPDSDDIEYEYLGPSLGNPYR